MVKTKGKSTKSSKKTEKNVAVKSGSGVLTRSRTATTLRSLFKQLEHDGAAVQNQLVFTTPPNCTVRIPNAAARKPLSVAAAAAIRAIKVPWGAASNTAKLTAARRIIGKNDARSPNRGKQPAEEFTVENAPHENQVAQDSCPSSDSSRNSNPSTLRSCRSLEKEGVSPTASQFELQMERFVSKIAGEHVEFQPRPSMVPSSTEFVDKVQTSALIDVSLDATPGCQQKTSEINAEKRNEIHRAHSFNLTEMAAMMNHSCSNDEEAESSIDPTLITVEGYSVKKEVAPLLQQIIDKHKDIARDCNFKSRKNRVPFLEMICFICQTLENTSLKHIIHDELEDMSCAVEGLQHMGFDVKWLSERLEDIFTVKHLLKDYLALKEENARKIEIKQREVEMLKQKFSAAKAELVTMKAEVNEVNHKANQQIKGLMLKGLPFWDKSLLHGLI